MPFSRDGPVKEQVTKVGMKAVNEARVVLKSHPLVRSSARALLRRGMPPASHDITLLIGTEDARLAGYTPTVMLTVLCSIDQLLMLMSAISRACALCTHVGCGPCSMYTVSLSAHESSILKALVTLPTTHFL